VSLHEVTVNGNPYHVDLLKNGLPPSGKLECRYQVRNQRFEASYFLDLSNNRDRALAIRLRERALSESGENWINARLNGVPLKLDDTRDNWDVPSYGILEFDYKSTRPRQMEVQHLELELTDGWDHTVGEAFLERAFLEEGTNVHNSELDGRLFEITETVIQLRCLPHLGRWTFDYVSMVDATERAVAKMKRSTFELDCSESKDFNTAQEMRLRALSEPDVEMVDCQHDGKPFVFRKTGQWKVPQSGMLCFTIVATENAEERFKESDLERLNATLLRVANPMERISHLADVIQSSRFSCKQAQKLLRVFDSTQQVQEGIVLLYPRLIDPWRLNVLIRAALLDEDQELHIRKQIEKKCAKNK